MDGLEDSEVDSGSSLARSGGPSSSSRASRALALSARMSYNVKLMVEKSGHGKIKPTNQDLMEMSKVFKATNKKT